MDWAMKLGTLDLMKFKRLQRRLNESVRGTVGLLELIWMRAARDCPQGDIGRLTNLEIAIMADWTGDADELVAALTECGWFDPIDSEARLLIHDWPEHVPNWVKGVVKRKGGFLLYGSQPSVGNYESPTMIPQPCLTYSSLTNSSLSPPPTPAPRDSGDAEFQELSDGWKAVVAELALEGVRLPEKACDAARARECTPTDVRNVLEFWRANKPAWNAGALYYRVLGLRPTESPGARWPAKSAEFEQLEKSKATAAATTKAIEHREDSQASRQRIWAEREQLEQEFGGVLDAMSRKAVVSLVAEVFPDKTEFYAMQVPKKGQVTNPLRGSLLTHLKQKAAT